MDTDTIFLFPPFWLDVHNEQLWRDAQALALRPKTFAVLRYLAARAGQLVTQEALLDAVWGATAVSDAVVRRSIGELRTALGDTAQHPRFIQTVHRRGYRFIAPVAVAITPPVSSPATEALRPVPRPTFPEPEAPVWHPTEPSLEEEHKLVTVLCCAVTDAPALAVEHGPEAMHRLMQAVFARAREVMQRYEGTITSVTGEGLTALFGAPLGQEDHARRAVLAALELRQALRTHPLGDVHVVGMGVHTGPVVVGRLAHAPQQLYTAMGDTLHQASQLQRLAPPGTILLSAATQALVQEEVRVTAFNAPTLSGPRGPLAVYMVQDLTQRRAGVSGLGTRHRSTFVGRERELALLHARLAHVAQGQGQVLGIAGEPGIGKSRLLAEWRRSLAGQLVTYREGHCFPYSSTTPYLPVRDLFRQGCGCTEADGAEGCTAKVHRYLDNAHLLSEDNASLLFQLLDVPVDGEWLTRFSPQEHKVRTFALLQHLVLHDCRHQPLVLAIENLHWIDATSEAWLTALVEHLDGAAILLVVTHRPGYRPPWLAQSVATQVALPRLLPEESLTVVQSVLQTTPLPVPLLQTIITKAGGNPFFLEQLAWTVHEQGPHTEVLGLPETIQTVLAARLDRLPSIAKRLLQTAAVIGTEVAVPLLQAVADLPTEALDQALAYLQAAECLTEMPLVPERRYTFKHALLQEAAYQSLWRSARQQLHQHIAQVLERQFPEISAAQPQLLAQHYAEAGQPAQAIPYWQRAGQRALERSAHTEAIRHFTHGLALLPALADTPEGIQHEVVLQTALGSALIATKGYAAPEVAHAYARAHVLCQRVGAGPGDPAPTQSRQTPQLFAALRGLWVLKEAQAEPQPAREIGEHLLALAQRLHDTALLVEAHRALGNSFFWLGAFAAAQTHLEQALALYDPQHHRTLAVRYGTDPGVVCRSYGAWALWLLGYPTQALQGSRQGLTCAQALAHAESLAVALTWAIHLHQARREFQVAQTYAEALLALATERGFPYWYAEGTILRGHTLATQGQAEEGTAQIRQGLSAYRATGATLGQSYFLSQLAEAYGWSGRVEAGLETLAEARRLVDTTGECFYEAEIARLTGDLLLQTGLQRVASGRRTPRAARHPSRVAEAERYFHQALTVARHQQAKSLELRAATSLARLWQWQDKRAEAYDLLAPIYDCFTEGFDTADLQDAKALLAELSSPSIKFLHISSKE
jgi:class 3 adenylate cyclase/predicted ATPase